MLLHALPLRHVIIIGDMVVAICFSFIVAFTVISHIVYTLQPLNIIDENINMFISWLTIAITFTALITRHIITLSRRSHTTIYHYSRLFTRASARAGVCLSPSIDIRDISRHLLFTPSHICFHATTIHYRLFTMVINGIMRHITYADVFSFSSRTTIVIVITPSPLASLLTVTPTHGTLLSRCCLHMPTIFVTSHFSTYVIIIRHTHYHTLFHCFTINTYLHYYFSFHYAPHISIIRHADDRRHDIHATWRTSHTLILLLSYDELYYIEWPPFRDILSASYYRQYLADRALCLRYRLLFIYIVFHCYNIYCVCCHLLARWLVGRRYTYAISRT